MAEREYHEYSQEEREQLANTRQMQMMGVHGELQAMLTFLCFGFGSIGMAAKDGNPELVRQAIAAVKNDVNDVARATNKLVATYASILEDLEREWTDSLNHKERTSAEPS